MQQGVAAVPDKPVGESKSIEQQLEDKQADKRKESKSSGDLWSGRKKAQTSPHPDSGKNSKTPWIKNAVKPTSGEKQ